MLAPRLRGAFFFSLAALVAACGSSGTEPSGGGITPTTSLTSVIDTSGNGASGSAGSVLPIAVKVTKSLAALSGTSVTFAVTSGSATVLPATATTDASGRAATNVTLGSTPGPVVVTATVANTSLVAVFNLGNGTLASTTAACQSDTVATPAAGGVITDLTGTGICLGGGSSGAQYALVAFYGNPDSSQVASLHVQSTGGVTGLTSASEVPALNEATAGLGVSMSPRNTMQEAFSAHLRDVARDELTARIPGARLAAQERPEFSTLPASPAVGTLVKLNAQGVDACNNPIYVTARVAAVSNTAIVVADTANPPGGFSDAEYQGFATMFDTLIDPLDVQNFGQPSDIDGNGRIIIFFTKEVNKLTPRGSLGEVGGFFFERDLFPTTSTPTLQGCAGSNYAEIYYALVPDPNAVYSDARTKSDVQTLTPGTEAHEFQHLINASRRIYVNNADRFEETWLNEGLSHIAEELLYYRVSGLTPRQNITSTMLTASAAEINAFNNYQGDNTGRYEVFLSKPNQTSVYAGNDSLETRGATWSLLRYLADHRGSSDADTWSRLDNTALTGQQNVANVFGTNYMTQIRDWATSVFADDLRGQSDTRFSQPSWDYRNIFPSLVDDSGEQLGSYPLEVFPLSDATPVNVSIDAGGVAYIRFAVPANGRVSIDWSGALGLNLSTLMQFSVVRSR